MESKVDNKLDQFTEKLMQDFSGETPSFDFTTRVMSKVEALSKARITTYEPLISKKIWVLLGLTVLAVFSYLIFDYKKFENTWFSAYEFKPMHNYNWTTLPDFEVSTVVIYATIGFSFFMSLQIFLLKNHFNKRFV